MKSHCPHCGTAISVGEHLAGKTVACPKCKEHISIPPIGRTVSPSSQTPSTPPESETISNEASSDMSAFAGIAKSSSLNFTRAAGQRFKPATSWFDLLDWKLEKYLTPWIVRAYWLFSIVIAGLWIVVILLSTLFSLMPEMPESRLGPDIGQPSQTQPYNTFEGPTNTIIPKWLSFRLIKIIGAFVSIIATILVMLFLRLVLETTIVLFNISTTLSSIDDKTG